MVFVLYAEDRGLLSNDPIYLNSYSLSALVLSELSAAECGTNAARLFKTEGSPVKKEAVYSEVRRP
jgi:hypothetical protein